MSINRRNFITAAGLVSLSPNILLSKNNNNLQRFQFPKGSLKFQSGLYDASDGHVTECKTFRGYLLCCSLQAFSISTILLETFEQHRDFILNVILPHLKETFTFNIDVKVTKFEHSTLVVWSFITENNEMGHIDCCIMTSKL